MSGSLHAWYSMGDLGALGERGATLSGEIRLHRLARLRDLLHADGGSVRASFHFRQRRSGYITMELAYETTLELVCQRCLEPMEHHIHERVRMALLETASMQSHVPRDCEPVLIEGERLMPAVLIEDELIVSLPLVPRHARTDECGKLAQRLESSSEDSADQARDDSPPPRSH